MKAIAKKAQAPTAREINDAHRMARTSAETAVEHAIRCGQMLIARKEAMEHGEFQKWITQYCQFAYKTAARYMRAATQKSTGVDFSTLDELYGSKTSEKSSEPKRLSTPDTKARDASPEVMNPPESAAQGSEAGNLNTGHGAPQEPVRPPAPEVDVAPQVSSDFLNDEIAPPEMPTEDEMAEIDDAIEREYSDSIAKVMVADDKLAAAHAEIKRQAAEIATLKYSRDGFMNGKEAVLQLLKAEQRKTARLEKKLQASEEELNALRERIAIMETA